MPDQYGKLQNPLDFTVQIRHPGRTRQMSEDMGSYWGKVDVDEVLSVL